MDYANKIITTGEGGTVLTNNAQLASCARSYRNLCFREEERFFHTELGYNFCMTNLQAVVGLAQVEQINKFINIKVKNADLYREGLSLIKGIRFMPVKPFAKSVYCVYAVELDPNLGVEA